MSSPFLDLPGAVDSAGADAGVPAHYGSPLAEQRLLIGSEPALVDLSVRGVLTVTGPDRLTWLHAITSQHLTGLRPGDSAETLILDVHGHIEHAIRILDDGESVWMLVEAGQVAPLLAWLESMKFMMRVEFADRTPDIATLGTLNADALDLPVVESNGVPLVWHDPWPRVVAGGHQYAGPDHPGADWTWSEALVARSELPGIVGRVRAGQFAVAGLLAAEALRVEAWRPRFATEVDDRAIPHELDWLRSAVHLTKGCYRGQETVAKVHNLGHPPRRLVLLQLDGSEGLLPAPGDEVRGERAGEPVVVGRITSAARHHELGPIALALIKRTTDPDAPLTVSSEGTDIAAAQETIVPVDAGATAGVPRIPRVGGTARRRKA